MVNTYMVKHQKEISDCIAHFMIDSIVSDTTQELCMTTANISPKYLRNEGRRRHATASDDVILTTPSPRHFISTRKMKLFHGTTFEQRYILMQYEAGVSKL